MTQEIEATSNTDQNLRKFYFKVTSHVSVEVPTKKEAYQVMQANYPIDYLSLDFESAWLPHWAASGSFSENTHSNDICTEWAQDLLQAVGIDFHAIDDDKTGKLDAVESYLILAALNCSELLDYAVPVLPSQTNHKKPSRWSKMWSSVKKGF